MKEDIRELTELSAKTNQLLKQLLDRWERLGKIFEENERKREEKYRQDFLDLAMISVLPEFVRSELELIGATEKSVRYARHLWVSREAVRMQEESNKKSS